MPLNITRNSAMNRLELSKVELNGVEGSSYIASASCNQQKPAYLQDRVKTLNTEVSGKSCRMLFWLLVFFPFD